MMIDSPKKGDYVMPPIDVPKRGGHKYEDAVIKEAQRLGVDPSLALHVLYKETGNLKNPETAKSSAGALGVMQLMPKTAKGLGVDPLNPEENIRGGVTYLKQMYDKYQDPTLALAAYNAGPGRLDKALKSGQGIMGLPKETQNYVRMNITTTISAKMRMTKKLPMNINAVEQMAMRKLVIKNWGRSSIILARPQSIRLLSQIFLVCWRHLWFKTCLSKLFTNQSKFRSAPHETKPAGHNITTDWIVI